MPAKQPLHLVAPLLDSPDVVSFDLPVCLRWDNRRHSRIKHQLARLVALISAIHDHCRTVTVQKIKTGKNIRSARLEVLADLYQFGYEAMFADHLTTENFGILCEDDSYGLGGITNARLQELVLEWSTTLSPNISPANNLTDDEDYLEEDSDADQGGSEMAIARIVRDVRAIRGKLGNLYQTAVIVLVFLVLSQVLNSIGL